MFTQDPNKLKIGDHVSEYSGIDDTGFNWKPGYVKTDFLISYFYPAEPRRLALSVMKKPILIIGRNKFWR